MFLLLFDFRKNDTGESGRISTTGYYSRFLGGPFGVRKNFYGRSRVTVIFNFTINYHI